MAVTETLEKLAAAGIAIVPVESVSTHFFLARDEFAALVKREDDGFGPPGSAGLITPSGFTALVWRGEQPFFVGKGTEQAATQAQVAALRRFSDELKDIFGG